MARQRRHQVESQPQQNLTETQTVTSCSSFDFEVQYFNPQTGAATREVKFSADWDEANAAFVVPGPLIHGYFRVLRAGQFVVSFETTLRETPPIARK